MTIEEIIHFIHEKRTKQGISIKHVAIRAGINPDNWSKYERGTRVPKYPALSKMLRALGYELYMRKIIKIED